MVILVINACHGQFRGNVMVVDGSVRGQVVEFGSIHF